MRHGNGYRKLNRTSEHRAAMLRNMMRLFGYETLGPKVPKKNTPEWFREKAAIEERARTDLGMVKPNETFFQVVPPAQAGVPASTPATPTEQRTAQADVP